MADKYGADALRYYLTSDMVTGKDSDFSEERLIMRYDSELANDLGNLLNRTLNMLQRYRKGVVVSHRSANAWNDSKEGAQIVLNEYRDSSDQFQIEAGFASVARQIEFSNAIIEMRAPWRLAKSPEPADQVILEEVLHGRVELLRIIAILVSPVLPKAAHGIFDQLNWKMELSGKEERFSLAEAGWGRLPDGHVVGKPVPLFPRIERDSG